MSEALKSLPGALTTFSPEMLNKVWNEWMSVNYPDRSFHENYTRASRRYYESQKFEQWLFKHTAIVVRKDKKCYLSFMDAEEALCFRLKYGV